MPLLKAGTFKLAVGWELKLVVSANLYVVRKLQVNDRPVGNKFFFKHKESAFFTAPLDKSLIQVRILAAAADKELYFSEKV